MRHKVFGNQLGRPTNQAKALYRSLVTEVLSRGRVKTTRAKAKAVQGEIDKMINFSKQATPHARRLMLKALGADRLFDKFAKSFGDRKSGYSRIVRLGPRLSDAAEMVILELVEKIEPKQEETKEGPKTKHEH